MSRSNVLRFPNDPGGGKGLKLYAILVYLVLASCVVFPTPLLSMLGIIKAPLTPPMPNEGCIGLLLVLGALYGLVVRQWHKNNPYLSQKPWFGIVIGFLLALSVMDHITVIAILAAGYWLLVSRTRREAPYFLRFHLLTALISTGFLLLAVLIFQAIIVWLESIFKITGLGMVISLNYWYQLVWPYCAAFAFWGMAMWFSFNVLMGRTPYLPLVTDNVRQLA
jgi:hypothetical protein